MKKPEAPDTFEESARLVESGDSLRRMIDQVPAEHRARGVAAGVGGAVGGALGSILRGSVGAAVGGALGLLLSVAVHEQLQRKGSAREA